MGTVQQTLPLAPEKQRRAWGTQDPNLANQVMAFWQESSFRNGADQFVKDRKSRKNNDTRFTIFLVDDDAGVLKALSRLLRTSGYDIRTFQSVEQFFCEHDASVPGCLIVDLALPDGTGLEIQEKLVRDGVERPVIFLTGTADVVTSVRAMKAGAIDFLTKPVQERVLVAAIRRAAEEDTRMRQARRDRAFVDGLFSQLTPREREVLMHVIVGRLNKQIAGAMGTVEKTVKVHRGRMMSKLGVRNVAELIRLSRRAGLLADI